MKAVKIIDKGKLTFRQVGLVLNEVTKQIELGQSGEYTCYLDANIYKVKIDSRKTQTLVWIKFINCFEDIFDEVEREFWYGRESMLCPAEN